MALKAAFQASRLTASTFLIKEYDDVFSEHPHIYAKIAGDANSILIIDTGCGGRSTDNGTAITSLREFIETVAVKDNDGVPLNEGGKLDYIVALSHCHYDHILGVEDFATDALILSSSHSPGFLDKSVIAEHSLCKDLGIKTPSYVPTLVPDHYDIVSQRSPYRSLGVTILHTPGHTPDEIALYDDGEMMLYVGDTLYEDEPIIFPAQGSITTWFHSMDFMISFVQERNAERKGGPNGDAKHHSEVQINAGHCTSLRPALEVLTGARAFLQDVVDEKERVKKTEWYKGQKRVSYAQENGRFSLRCPERLVLEAKR